MVHVVDLLDLWVLGLADSVESALLADSSESWAQAGEGFHGGAGADGLIAVQQGHAVDVLDGHYGAVKASLFPGFGSALVRAGSVGIQVFAGLAVQGGDDVRGDALWDEVVVEVAGWIQCQRAAVGAHGHAGHGFHATGEDQVIPAGADLLRREVHGGQARSTVAVHLQAGCGVGQSSIEGCGAGDVHALVAHWGDHTSDDIADDVWINAWVALDERFDESAEQIHRLDRVQGAAWLTLSTWGAYCVVNKGL